MPIDYSKFDSIEDSDDEGAQKSRARATPGGGGSAPSRPAPAPAPRKPAIGPSGAELLEPAGLAASLRVAAPSSGGSGDAAELDRLASQLEKWGAASGPEAAAAPPGGAAKPDARKAGEPQRLCMRSDGRKKIHTTFPDGAEMVEEFDEKADVLLLRKVRKPTTLGKEADWVFEVGQPPEAAFDPHADLMRASSSNPIFLRKDTPEHFQWRIRNLPYPPEVYNVSVDHEKQEIIVRTSNKKYYKRIQLPDLARLGLKMQDSMLSWKHQHSTLIISYLRPAEVTQAEQKVLKEAEKSALKM